MEILKRVSEFLGYPVPEKIQLGDHSIEAMLDRAAIMELIPERGHALFAEKAVILNGGEHVTCIVTVPITDEMCDGHIPGAPILPLAIGGWMLSQCGEILVAHQSRCAGETDTVPIVYEVGGVQSKNRDFLLPGDCLILVGELINHRLVLWKVNTMAWLSGGNQVVAMPDVLYTTISKEQLERRVREQSQKRRS